MRYLLVLVLLLSFSACSIEDTYVPIEAEHLVCETNEDCTTIITSCSGCECGDPVHVDYVDYYKELSDEACTYYREDPDCAVLCVNLDVACVEGVCTTVFGE